MLHQDDQDGKIRRQGAQEGWYRLVAASGGDERDHVEAIFSTIL